ncbi:Apolipoprotein N-acyltransferase [subsurface metagenome]
MILLLHCAAGPAHIVRAGKTRRVRVFVLFRLPELLFTVSLVFFLFAYIYALNANMDYVQRFMAGGGGVRLALDTSRERLTAAVRFLPLLLLNGAGYIYFRLKRDFLLIRVLGSSFFSIWALPLVLFSVILGVLAFPSSISLEGYPFLAFGALIPLFLVLEFNPWRWSLFYLVSFGVLQGMLLNYWLGTFSLITLQLVTLFFLLSYLLFFAPILWLYNRTRNFRFLVMPLAWVFFELLRSSGFWGFSWGLWGTTQYRFLPLIQLASITGVWGLSFLVLLVNSCLALTVAGFLRGGRQGGKRGLIIIPGPSGAPGNRCRRYWPLFIATALFLLCVVGGAAALFWRSRIPYQKSLRVALIQQNSDPRKHEYRETFKTLTRLTDLAAQAEPDLIVWSETAFVPNISRWSTYDPEKYPLAALVRDFLAYQRGLSSWLLTGNDDYELRRDQEGRESRLDYNAAVLFSPEGRRVRTYHKVHLVPFTEYFPWKESLPGIYRLLLNFDVYLWEPGTERVVFQHPGFSFATPICFEDAFPNDIRSFVLAGAEAIINISNDFWSLTEVEAKQHAVNAAFRAVENRVPLLRATASGLTCNVDTEGRFRAEAPYYEEAYLIVDARLKGSPMTLYTRFGDWFPIFTGIITALLLICSLVPGLKERL